MTPALLSIVIPVKNEEKILWDNVSLLANHFDRLIGKQQWQFIFVNNNSTDHSQLILEKISTAWPQSKTIFEAKKGYSATLRAGLNQVNTPFALIVDVEQWDIPFIVWAWKHREEYDLLIGSKRLEPDLCQQPWYRRTLSWGLNKLLQSLFKYSGTETHGQKLIRLYRMKPIIESCKMKFSLYDTEFVLRANRGGCAIAEAAVEFKEMRPSRNSMLEKLMRNIIGIIKLYAIMRKIPFRSINELHGFSRNDVLLEYNTFLKAREGVS